ncbi:hypothetical protein [Arthrospiribacter ruber]|uniref:Lipoprotein n=1 Tax=Arthrospiribacter ruber TaxID=2487934 RepID=A0A951J546_9BACT|nr:hypothetical protein [Arthrospiribacter ruber]MBW3470162.1 hypothetical protein [Arthrospiribacter ruber]
MEKIKNRAMMISLIIGLVVLGFGCVEDDDLRVFETTGYIFGFDPCLTREPYENGEGLLIATPTDTLLTYNFPENIVEFPSGIFDNWQWQYVFDLQATEGNPDFKIRFSYRIARDEEMVFPLCHGSIFAPGFKYKYQIIILSTEKIDL